MAKPWINLTADDLRARLSGLELDRVGSAKLAQGQTAEGVIAEAIDGVVKWVRGFLKDKPVGPEGTIPDEIKDSVLAIIRLRVFTRLPNLGLVGEDRSTEYRDAVRFIQSIPGSDFRYDLPTDEIEADVASPTIDVVTSAPRQASRSQLSGL